MSLPSFTQQAKLSEGSQTTQQSIIRAFNGLTANLTQIFTSLLKRVQLDSVLLTRVELNEGSTTIPHTLGRTLSGWQVVRQRGPGRIYDTQDTNTSQGTYLQLVSSAAVSVDLLVF